MKRDCIEITFDCSDLNDAIDEIKSKANLLELFRNRLRDCLSGVSGLDLVTAPGASKQIVSMKILSRRIELARSALRALNLDVAHDILSKKIDHRRSEELSQPATVTLSDIGITRSQSSRYQQESSVPQDKYEEWIEGVLSSETQRAMVAARVRPRFEVLAKERQKVRKGNQPGTTPVTLPELQKGDARDQAGKAVGVSGSLVDRGTIVPSELPPAEKSA